MVGILPRFMADLEWGHPGLTHLELVEDMRERNYFTPADRPKGDWAYHQFGATLGGPVVRNKLFYFGSYESTRDKQNATRTVSVPSEALRGGELVRAAADPHARERGELDLPGHAGRRVISDRPDGASRGMSHFYHGTSGHDRETRRSAS